VKSLLKKHLVSSREERIVEERSPTGRATQDDCGPELGKRKEMVTVRKADPALMDKGSPRPRELSPAAREREQQQRQFKRLIAQLRGPEQVFEVRLDPDEKPITIRQRLLRVAAEAAVEIAVRKHGDGFLVGLLTPERRTNRGRRAAGAEAKI